MHPATLDDRRAIYDWMVHPDIAPSMFGPPMFPEVPVPMYEAFCADYPLYYFDDSEPRRGRCFIIENEVTPVGHVSYSDIHERPDISELDIWMRDGSCCGHGWGPEALDLLCRHLQTTFGIHEFIMRPSRRNDRAVRAYGAAGFVEQPMTNERQTQLFGEGDYHDTVVMLRTL